MKTLLNNLTICVLAFALVLSTVSCKKEELIIIKKEQKTEEIVPDMWWQWVIGGIAYVIGQISSGQYSQITGPGGTTTSCKGLGHCSINMVLEDENGTLPVSSTRYYDLPDYEFRGILGKDKNDHIVIAMEDSYENHSSFKQFFYADIISFSRPLIIDNPTVLKMLKVRDNIIVQGDYKVFSYFENGSELKYIIIK